MKTADRADTESPSAVTEPEATGGFAVALENFSGPFDVLLNLIGKHQLDITEIALAKVTDEFIAYLRVLREREGEGALEETTSFLVVASTLLDLKAARLLPAGTTDTEADEALLEARDLLFARLLQYKAFKDVSAMMSTRMADEARRFPRQTSLDPRFAALLPELVWTLSPEQFAALAQDVLTRTPEEKPQGVGLAHLHAPAVSVREQAGLIAARLQQAGRLSFAELVADEESATP